MNTQNDGWIKIEDRKPTCEELPFWVVTPSGVWLWDKSTYPLSVIGLSEKSNIVTHWKPATVPAPPAKEKTQRDADEWEFAHWQTRLMTSNYTDLDVWLAALAYRDKQNAEDIGAPLSKDDPSWGVMPFKSFERLRRRCGLEQ